MVVAASLVLFGAITAFRFDLGAMFGVGGWAGVMQKATTGRHPCREG